HEGKDQEGFKQGRDRTKEEQGWYQRRREAKGRASKTPEATPMEGPKLLVATGGAGGGRRD
ncbi:hypothetical protein GW17_00015204, partial [Ensete ventricosum]